MSPRSVSNLPRRWRGYAFVMTSIPPQPTAREVAFHEAGHIFAGKKFGKTFISAEIRPEQLTGRAETIWLEEASSTLVEGITASAGVCAEALCKGQSAPKVFPPSLYGAVSDDESIARNSAILQSNQPGETKTEDDLVEHYLVWAEQTCIADGHWEVIEEIAKLLEANRKVDDSEVIAIFERHGVKAGL